MRHALYVLSTILLLTVSGCGVVRHVEQWKCDNWGICHHGIQPSQPCPPCACEPVPMQGYPAPACPDCSR